MADELRTEPKPTDEDTRDDWMQNPNVRLALYVSIAMMPALVADMSSNKLALLTAVVMASNGLLAAKAFMSDPRREPPRE